MLNVCLCGGDGKTFFALHISSQFLFQYTFFALPPFSSSDKGQRSQGRSSCALLFFTSV